MPKTLKVETIQLADPTELLQSPRFEFQVAFTDSHKVATHVCPENANTRVPSLTCRIAL